MEKAHFFDDPQLVWDWLESIGHGADSPPPEEENNHYWLKTNKNRLRRRGAKRGTRPTVIPHPEQLIRERQKALQSATALTDSPTRAEPALNADSLNSEDGSVTTWPSQSETNGLPKITPQTADEKI